jgi:hypothetical protein
MRVKAAKLYYSLLDNVPETAQLSPNEFKQITQKLCAKTVDEGIVIYRKAVTDHLLIKRTAVNKS